MLDKNLLAQWQKLYNSDLNAARLLAKSPELLLSVFHLQQATEKALKTYYIYSKSEQPPYLHNLVELTKRANLTLTEEQFDLLDKLNPFYIKCRYPSYRKALELNLNQKIVDQLYRSTKEFIKWLENLMK